MNSLKAMYGCGLNFFIKLAYNSLFYISLQKINCIPAIEASFHYATLQYQVT